MFSDTYCNKYFCPTVCIAEIFFYMFSSLYVFKQLPTLQVLNKLQCSFVSKCNTSRLILGLHVTS